MRPESELNDDLNIVVQTMEQCRSSWRSIIVLIGGAADVWAEFCNLVQLRLCNPQRKIKISIERKSGTKK